MTLATGVFAADEDVYVRAPADFVNLCPVSQVMAKGTDGVVAAGLWTLASASVNFLGRQVDAGTTVVLYGPKPQFTTSGQVFVVDSVDPSGSFVTLRQPGLATGIGEPPCAAGVTGVSFYFPTMRQQIITASNDMSDEFGIDPNNALHSPALVYDPNSALVTCTVLTVLCRMYADSARAPGDWLEKVKDFRDTLRERKQRLSLQFGALGQGELPVSKFSCTYRR